MTGGRCLWEAVVNDSRVAEVIRPPSGLQCSQMTLSPKGLETTLVTVYDIGVSPPLSALAVIKVADMDWIKIASGDEISIMVLPFLQFVINSFFWLRIALLSLV